MINSCAVLHNMLINHGLNGEEFDQPIVIEEDPGNNRIAENAITRQGEISRNFAGQFFINNNN